MRKDICHCERSLPSEGQGEAISRGYKWRLLRPCGLTMTILLLAMTTFAQTPSLNLPPPPTQPLSVVFKNITKQDQFRLVLQALKKSKRVEQLVMARAERGFIEYKGRFFGEPDSLQQELQYSIEGKVNIEFKPKSDASLEILVTSE